MEIIAGSSQITIPPDDGSDVKALAQPHPSRRGTSHAAPVSSLSPGGGLERWAAWATARFPFRSQQFTSTRSKREVLQSFHDLFRPSRLCGDLAIGRGCRQWKSVHPHHRSHTSPAFTTGFRKRATTVESRGKRLCNFVQTREDQTKGLVKPAPKPRNGVRS